MPVFEVVIQDIFLCLSFSLLKGRDTDGFPVYQEKFIRECIRKFPYCDITLLQQLVRSIAPVEIVSPDDLLLRMVVVVVVVHQKPF